MLRLFPTKPFYLTEYGYNTRDIQACGGYSVSQTQQAQYLRTAFNYVNRYSQVRMLLWLLDRDAKPDAGLTRDLGIYTGLREANGTRKLSWLVYAGGNHVSLLAPDRARRGSS